MVGFIDSIKENLRKWEELLEIEEIFE